MSIPFRDLLKKVGSGTHTSIDLSREESALATQMMLEQTATPAQIGAFMIAQRIKRPSISELVGMLDCYEQLGPQLHSPGGAPIVLNNPYDGRTRTAPVVPLTALILAAAGVPTVLHGGDRMPTKYGLPLVESWLTLGLDWRALSLPQVQTVFEKTSLGFVYLPQHFPAAHGLTEYRDQIGKRPTLATVELMWTPHPQPCHAVSSFVHPPTEDRTRQAYWQRQSYHFTTVKGLEGSCDLPRSRTVILGLGNVDQRGEPLFERLLLHPKDYGFEGEDMALDETYATAMAGAVVGSSGELTQAAIWNGGFYLWRMGAAASIEAGLSQAQTLLETGQAAAKLQQIKDAIAAASNLGSADGSEEQRPEQRPDQPSERIPSSSSSISP